MMTTLGVPRSGLSIASDEIVRFPVVSFNSDHGVLSNGRDYAHA